MNNKGIFNPTAVPEGYLPAGVQVLPSKSRTPALLREFREEMNLLARRMARTPVDLARQDNRHTPKKTAAPIPMGSHGTFINRELAKTLSKMFAEAAYDVFNTEIPVVDKQGRPVIKNGELVMQHKRFYRLHDSDRAYMLDFLEKPHFGNLILTRGESGKLYIPLEAAYIPFNLDRAAIEGLGGSIAHILLKAYEQGLQDIRRKETRPARALRDAVRSEDDSEFDEDFISEALSRPLATIEEKKRRDLALSENQRLQREKKARAAIAQSLQPRNIASLTPVVSPVQNSLAYKSAARRRQEQRAAERLQRLIHDREVKARHEKMRQERNRSLREAETKRLQETLAKRRILHVVKQPHGLSTSTLLETMSAIFLVAPPAREAVQSNPLKIERAFRAQNAPRALQRIAAELVALHL